MCVFILFLEYYTAVASLHSHLLTNGVQRSSYSILYVFVGVDVVLKKGIAVS